ncbi:glycosyltransferase family 4 protein [Gramella sp. GC03-9]|uniref:Glycosyltransferase family 4 protein n=1 Tax=Christiangramia oceanisediminis TaxID=2920386 RepID=A0A9X2I2L8_9FLAO|nr:glycosyltransferase family 4 protein [Gramella oceanisediminis]MCP9198700.1 glycosyltransferase family 4 protein [Gramella oceanisediminis]
MKILFISHRFYPEVGGIEVNSEILATYFSKFGAEVHLLTWTRETGEKTFPFLVIRDPSLQQIIKEHKWAEIVYENNPCLKLSWPSVVYNKLNVIAIRTWVARQNGKKGWQDHLKTLKLGKANRLIAVSKPIADSLNSDAVIIGNPYRDELFRIKAEIARNNDFVFLGRLVSDKGVDMAVQLLYLIKNRNDKYFSLTVIGEGPEKKTLEDLVKKLELNNQVKFKGVLKGEDLVDELNRHQYILVPSRWREPFGNIALEGMACGCIPIVSGDGGLVDAVGEAGVIFTRNNMESFYSETWKLIEDSQLQEELKSKARPHLDDHSSEKVAEKYFEVLKNVFKNHQAECLK